MSWADNFLNAAIMIALAAIIISLGLIVIRLIRGPTLPDRILSLDMLVTVAVGFITVIAIHSQQRSYIDVAISLGLVGLLATIAFARYVIYRGLQNEEADEGKEQEPEAETVDSGKRSDVGENSESQTPSSNQRWL
ncbi:MAG: cation:proton antiporter [Hyphomicrobiales bacterium]